MSLWSGREGCWFVRYRLFRCRSRPVAVCVYCGRPFCNDHGRFLSNAATVCNHPDCARRLVEIEEFKAYKLEAEARNLAGTCGHPGCPAEVWGQCSRCRRLFCEEHLSEVYEVYYQLGRRQRRYYSVCPYCRRFYKT